MWAAELPSWAQTISTEWWANNKCCFLFVVVKYTSPKIYHLHHFKWFKHMHTVVLPFQNLSFWQNWNSIPIKHFCFTDYAKAFDCMDHNKLWKILKEMGTSDHLTCLWRNLHASQEAIVRIKHGTTDWFQIGKGVRQGCILSPCLSILYAEYIMWNARLDEAHVGI